MANACRIDKIQEDKVFLDFFETNHLKISRKKKGDIILGLDGHGNIYKFKLIELNPKFSIGNILEKRKYKKPEPFINLYISSIKWKRMKYAIEKATEISTTSIHIIRSEFSNIKYDSQKIEKFQTTIIEASKQSLNPFFPDVIFHENYPKLNNEDLNIICDPEGVNLKSIEDKIFKSSSINVFIGPEGGFSDKDISFLNNSNKVNIAGNILRSETASLYLISILNYLTDRS